jgi:hypothetical protein
VANTRISETNCRMSGHFLLDASDAVKHKIHTLSKINGANRMGSGKQMT